MIVNIYKKLPILITLTIILTGCGGSNNETGQSQLQNSNTTPLDDTFIVSARTNSGGQVSPQSITVETDQTARFTLTPNSGYRLNNVTGCSGSLSGNIYTVSQATSDCSVDANFALATHTISANAEIGGNITPRSATHNYGQVTNFTISTDEGYNISNVVGCGGQLTGNTFTTAPITSNLLSPRRVPK